MPACRDCRFWKSHSKGGYCRRQPPVVTVEGRSSAFPKTDRADWCGEHMSAGEERYRNEVRGEEIDGPLICDNGNCQKEITGYVCRIDEVQGYFHFCDVDCMVAWYLELTDQAAEIDAAEGVAEADMEMHEIEQYTPEEKAELLARCRLLEHEWQVGDWAHIGVADNIGVIGDWLGNNIWLTNGGQLVRFDIEEDHILWLPTLDDIFRMKKWDNFGLFRIPYGWHVKIAGWNVSVIPSPEHFIEGPHPILAALRAIQRCDELCEFCPEPVTIAQLRVAPCIGIHPEEGPHRCLEHLNPEVA